MAHFHARGERYSQSPVEDCRKLHATVYSTMTCSRRPSRLPLMYLFLLVDRHILCLCLSGQGCLIRSAALDGAQGGCYTFPARLHPCQSSDCETGKYLAQAVTSLADLSSSSPCTYPVLHSIASAHSREDSHKGDNDILCREECVSARWGELCG
jgi:hypothetical protein